MQPGLQKSLIGASCSSWNSGPRYATFSTSSESFLDIKQKFSTTFYPQTDGQTERQNSTMDAYLKAFVNSEQNDWARLLPIAEFAYNNAKNTSTGHMLFKLNYDYHLHVSFQKDVNPCSKSSSADALAKELKNLILICQQNPLHAQEL